MDVGKIWIRENEWREPECGSQFGYEMVERLHREKVDPAKGHSDGIAFVLRRLVDLSTLAAFDESVAVTKPISFVCVCAVTLAYAFYPAISNKSGLPVFT